MVIDAQGKMMKIGWLYLMSHRRSNLETDITPFSVPCKGCEARFYTVPTGNRTLFVV